MAQRKWSHTIGADWIRSYTRVKQRASAVHHQWLYSCVQPQSFNPSGRAQFYSCLFTPQPSRLWGKVITRSGRAGSRAVRNSALTRKLTEEFCLFFTDMTYVPGQFIPYIFFWHQAISGHFPRWPPKKFVGTITYEPLVGLHSNLVWLFSRYF